MVRAPHSRLQPHGVKVEVPVASGGDNDNDEGRHVTSALILLIQTSVMQRAYSRPLSVYSTIAITW